MNAMNMARMAYTSGSAPIRTSQGTEYEAFARITRRIKLAVSGGAKSYPELVAALHENSRLWLFLATNVSEAESKLPDKLRAQIIYLNDFTRIHTKKVLERAAGVDPLVDINTSVMRGLRLQEAG